MKYGYIRVSTKEQHLSRQIDSINNYAQVEKIFSDKKSGRDFQREGYLELKSVLRPGDEVIIHALDRLGRNKEMVKEELKWMKENKVTVRILNVPTTLIDYQGQEWLFDMVNNILVEVMASIAQNEREETHVRQREGIEAAKARGEYNPGRPKKEIPAEYLARIQNGEISIATAAKELNMSRNTVRAILKRTEE